jgi:diguanylate cyclase (GGDEF)-like protein
MVHQRCNAGPPDDSEWPVTEDIPSSRSPRPAWATRTLSGPEDRALFLDLVGDALAGLSDDHIFVVLALALDNFSELSVARGDATAALVLSEVAHRLHERLTPADVIVWSAGHLFVVACELTDSPQQLEALQSRVLSCFQTPFLAANAPVYLPASVGIAFSTGARDDPHQLLGSAEVARSEARRAGGHRVVVFDRPARLALREQFELTQALHRALEHDELVVEYQPIVELASKSIKGFETSVRWQPRGRALVPGAIFSSLAEESGLAAPIGSWVLHQVVRHWADWSPAEGTTTAPWLSVNVSVEQLDSGFAGLSDDLVAAAEALSGRLTIEISESGLAHGPAGVAATLAWLKRLGVGVVVNHVGKDSSSLFSLRALPIDALKIDPTFTEHIEDNEHDQVIVTSVIELAHALGLVAIADGVTSETQLNSLNDLSCDLVQGPYLSGAAPFDDVQAALVERLWLGSRRRGASSTTSRGNDSARTGRETS